MTKLKALLVGKNKLFSLTLLALVLIVIFFVATKDWLYAFIKIKEMQIPFIMIFSFIFICILRILAWKLKPTIVTSLLLGTVVGQLSATIALTFANFFIRNGIERNLKSYKTEGLLNILLTDASVAFILGGWLIGAIVFMGYFWLSGKLEQT